MRRANTGHRDSNEPAIVAALRAAGAAVAIMAPPMPDLLVEYHGRVLMFEIKDRDRGKNPAKTRNHAGDVPACLTPAEAKWWRAWSAQGGSTPIVVLDVDQALLAIGARGPDCADDRRDRGARRQRATTNSAGDSDP